MSRTIMLVLGTIAGLIACGLMIRLVYQLLLSR